MSSGLVVAIKGTIDSGKSTLAEGLALHRGFIVMPLSDPVKGAVDDIDGRSRWLSKKIDLAPDLDRRKVWQTLGNEARYEVGCLDVWCQVAAMKMWLLHSMRHALGIRSLFAVPDFRHGEEYDYFAAFCEKNDFALVVIEVSRDNFGNENARYSDHSSERQRHLIPTDFTARNDGTVGSLIDQALLMLDPYIASVE